jgi:hypothetical protein
MPSTCSHRASDVPLSGERSRVRGCVLYAHALRSVLHASQKRLVGCSPREPFQVLGEIVRGDERLYVGLEIGSGRLV